MVCVVAAGVAILTASALAARQRPETFEIIIRGDGAYLGHYHSFEFDEDGNLFLHGSYDD